MLTVTPTPTATVAAQSDTSTPTPTATPMGGISQLQESEQSDHDRPYNLQASAADGAITFTWQDPTTHESHDLYVILRGRPELGEAELRVYAEYVTLTGRTFTDSEVEPGVLYVYAVKAVKDLGGFLGPASDPVEVRMPASESGEAVETNTPLTADTPTATPTAAPPTGHAYAYANCCAADGHAYANCCAADGHAYAKLLRRRRTRLRLRQLLRRRTDTPTPTAAPPTDTPTPTPTAAPPTDTPTPTPTAAPPTDTPTPTPTAAPPTDTPTPTPTAAPPTDTPTPTPTAAPPTDTPTPTPTAAPPTDTPTPTPTAAPPTDTPTATATVASPTDTPTPTTVPTPARPQGLQVTDVKHNSVTITWTDPGDSSISGYQILRRDRAVQETGQFSVIVENTGNAGTNYVDTTVAAGGNFVYRVKARNVAGLSTWSSYARADIPSAPTATPTATH